MLSSSSGLRWAKVPTAPENFPYPHIFGGAAKSSDVALGLGIPVGQLETKRDGFGVNAVSAPDHGCVFELPGAAFQHGGKFLQIGGDDDRSLLNQKSLRSIHHIVRGQAVMKPAGVRAHDLRDCSGEGDDVVTNFSFDFRNPVEVEVGALTNGVGGVLGHHARFGQSLGGGYFDRQPGAEAILVAPDAAHVGTGIAWDQPVSP